MSRIIKSSLLFFLLAFLAACGSKQPSGVVAPAPTHGPSTLFDPDVIPAIARMYGEPPPMGRTPRNPTWSGDGKHIAFIHRSISEDGVSVPELWVHEMEAHRERPVFASPNNPVAEFEWCGTGHMVALSGGNLFLVGVTGGRRQLTFSDKVLKGARCSPDGGKVAFVRDHDLIVIDFGTGQETSLTTGGNFERNYAEVTWVYAEEFLTDSGFAWSPDSRRIWLYATDVSRVRRKTVVTDLFGNTRQQVYPLPGEANPAVRVGVVEVTAAGKPEVVWLATGEDRDVYLPQVTWHPDSKRVVIARLDRLQTLLELLVCDGKTGGCSQIMAERDPRWVNLIGPPKFLRGGEEFLWLSEKSGFSHIHRFDIKGTRKGHVTEGPWTVTSIDAVDEKNQVVYFTANAGNTSEYRLFRQELDDDEYEAVLEDEEPNGCHQTDFSPDGAHFLDRHSALNRPPRIDIRSLEGGIQDLLSRSELREYRRPGIMSDIFPIETKQGRTLMALLTRPTVLDQKRTYPVLVYVYGGPLSQVVRNAYTSSSLPWREFMASRGVLVFSVDGRGSFGRGREFEAEIHRQLGKLELEDQLAGVDYLKTLPFVDPKRIGIFGWSYGGTMVLSALLRKDSVFAAGVAVAPVTDWRQYDSVYTERYMQRPSDNPKGYAAASLLARTSQLRKPLLLVHGLADDNVQFSNSALLIDALVKSGKNFETMVYPGKNHGIGGSATRAHLYSRITRFLERHL